MTREYLIVYEKAADNWSAFSPDIPGCGSVGDTLEDTRTNVREAVELYLSELAKAGESIPEAKTNAINIDEFDPEHETKQYFVEWLDAALPQSVSPTTEMQAA
jgi:predicted RNase H-like HicB family nuclease